MAYEYKESYKHKIAKELLFNWLKNTILNHDEKLSKWCRFAQFFWKPHHLVMEMVVQENDQQFYFEGTLRYAQDTYEDFATGNFQLCKKNYNEPLDGYGKILFVPDIVVFHCGRPIYIFEITHTNGLTKEKAEKMKEFFPYCRIYEIQAEDILRLDSAKNPEFIKCLEC
jgi:hypothetical protein